MEARAALVARALVRVAVAVPRVWVVSVAAVAVAVAPVVVAAVVLVAAAAVVVVVAVVVVAAAVAEGGKRIMKQNKTMKTCKIFLVAGLIFTVCVLAAQTTRAQAVAKAKSFPSAQEAADALIEAAEKFDQTALTEILGPDSYDIIHTGEPARDPRDWRRRLAVCSADRKDRFEVVV